MDRVEFEAPIGADGDMLIVANVSLGRPAPMACSDASYCDPGDGHEVELIDVLADDTDGRRHSIISQLSESEREKCRVAAIERAMWDREP